MNREYLNSFSDEQLENYLNTLKRRVKGILYDENRSQIVDPGVGSWESRIGENLWWDG